MRAARSWSPAHELSAYVGTYLNALVVLASPRHPLTAVSFAEVLHAADVPAGVVNLLTGRSDELLSHMAGHMDVNALALCDVDADVAADAERESAHNFKRVRRFDGTDWAEQTAAGPWHIEAFQEIKTTWHPVAG